MVRYTYASCPKNPVRYKTSEYNFNQTTVIRTSKQLGCRIANITDKITYIGKLDYSQPKRHELFNVASKSGWKWRKVVKWLKSNPPVNVDCSSLAAVVVNLAIGHVLFPSTTYSGNIAQIATKSKDFKYIPYKKGMYLQRGDIIVAPHKHVVIVTAKGHANV